jgi:ABC-type dipeptide/oligopeptide/nickel transport system permease subunit
MPWSIRVSGISRPAVQVSAGALVVGVAIVLGLFGTRLAPHDPLGYDVKNVLQGPSMRHLLGTDPLGRDVLSQIIVATRLSLAIGVLSVLIGMAAGTVVGLVAGNVPGRVSDLLMRGMDALLAFPSLVLVLAVTAFLGAGLLNVIGALAVTVVPTFALLVRGDVLALTKQDFVMSALALGAKRHRVMWRHLLPNLSDILLVQASFGIGIAILTEASLSFLGLGVPPPARSWGRMLREGYSFVLQAPWISISAGGAIFLIVLAFQMLADGLQSMLARRGPALRRGASG